MFGFLFLVAERGVAVFARARHVFCDARLLALAFAQVVELRASDLSALHDLDRGEVRRVEREDSFDPFAVGALAHGEAAAQPCVVACDAHSLEGLQAFVVAFTDAHLHAQRIACAKLRHGGSGSFGGALLAARERCFGDLCAFVGFDFRRSGHVVSRVAV